MYMRLLQSLLLLLPALQPQGPLSLTQATKHDPNSTLLRIQKVLTVLLLQLLLLRLELLSWQLVDLCGLEHPRLRHRLQTNPGLLLQQGLLVLPKPRLLLLLQLQLVLLCKQMLLHEQLLLLHQHLLLQMGPNVLDWRGCCLLGNNCCLLWSWWRRCWCLHLRLRLCLLLGLLGL
jgi:hypothetical protein